jgi:methyltransferase (TIGR00027 family)
VDHPATQADKQKHLSDLPPTIGDLTFVSVDFERESLDDALDRAGHDARAPTCWIWEGVVMYLTREAMQATLAGIAERSAPGSTLIVNYHAVNRSFIARMLFRLIGEPMISHWTPEQMAAELHAAGFAVRDDSGLLDWNIKYAGGACQVERGFYMRIVTARKT